MNNETAIILAGGKSRRMGEDKSLLSIYGKPMIAHIAERLSSHFDNIIIGANDIDKYKFLNYPVVPDKEKDCGPLMGILSCLERSDSDLNFVTACDIPDIDVGLIRKMLTESDNFDIVVPRTENGRYETLFAVYRKSIIPYAKEIITNGQRRIVKIFDKVRVKSIDVGENDWQKNLNTKKDYKNYTGMTSTSMHDNANGGSRLP